MTGTVVGNGSDIYASTGVGEAYFVKKTGESPHAGLYKVYEWGLWSASSSHLQSRQCARRVLTSLSHPPTGYCTTQGDLGDARSYCYTRSIHPSFQPAQVLLQDVNVEYAEVLKTVLPDNVFTADTCAFSERLSDLASCSHGAADTSDPVRPRADLGEWTQAATYLIMAGSLLSALTAIVSFFARRGCAFLLASLLNLGAFVGLFSGAMVYTVIVARARSAINDATSAGTDVGITLEYGNGLWVVWAACGLALCAVVPLAFAMCAGGARKVPSSEERLKERLSQEPSEVVVVANKEEQ